MTYAAGPVKSMVDYIIVRQEDKTKVLNVEVIPNEECLPKHKLLVMDMQLNATKRWHKILSTAFIACSNKFNNNNYITLHWTPFPFVNW